MAGLLDFRLISASDLCEFGRWPLSAVFFFRIAECITFRVDRKSVGEWKVSHRTKTSREVAAENSCGCQPVDHERKRATSREAAIAMCRAVAIWTAAIYRRFPFNAARQVLFQACCERSSFQIWMPCAARQSGNELPQAKLMAAFRGA